MADITNSPNPALAGLGAPAAESPAWLAFLRQLPVVPMAILVPFVILAVFADWIAPYDPTDAWLALPALVFAIFLATVAGPSMWNIVIILGLVYWTRYARVIRGEVLSLREREFVKLAEIAGASSARVILRHIVPNVLNST